MGISMRSERSHLRIFHLVAAHTNPKSQQQTAPKHGAEAMLPIKDTVVATNRLAKASSHATHHR